MRAAGVRGSRGGGAGGILGGRAGGGGRLGCTRRGFGVPQRAPAAAAALREAGGRKDRDTGPSTRPRGSGVLLAEIRETEQVWEETKVDLGQGDRVRGAQGHWGAVLDSSGKESQISGDTVGAAPDRESRVR